MDAPTGRVTLVFTDIEGSTPLWERYGEAFRAALARHDEILRECLARHSGFEVKTEGDAFFVAFRKPIEAARFAMDVQCALTKPLLPDGAKVLVRIGVHVGEPLVEVDSRGRPDYFGPAVNRAARIASAGHGGQTLLSRAAFSAAYGLLDESVDVVDLGRYRLKGLEQAEHLFQLSPEGAEKRRFPELRTVAETPTNLPAQTSTFIGREREIRALRKLLLGQEAPRTEVKPVQRLAAAPKSPAEPGDTSVMDAGGSRLITLTGAGGVGKSRLAIALAGDLLHRFHDGVWFVDLSEAQGEGGLCERVLATVTPGGAAVRRSPAAQVGAVLRNREALLILDTFEHLVAHAELVLGWLREAHRLRVLVTSREILRLDGETEFHVSPLKTPDEALEESTSTDRLTKRLSSYPAVQLFLERASAARPGIVLTPANAPAVADIVRRLDGMPLAIELAAARLRALTPQQLADRLAVNLDIVSSGGRTTRQTNLKKALEWSFSLLNAEEREALLMLSRFEGPFSLENAESLLADDGGEATMDALDAVFSLRDKSLLVIEGDEEKCLFRMLATVRSFARQKLSEAFPESRIEALFERHAGLFASHMQALSRLVDTPMGGALRDDELRGIDDAFSAEKWAIRRGRLELAVEIAYPLTQILARRGRFRQLRDAAEAILNALSEADHGLASEKLIPLYVTGARGYIHALDFASAGDALLRAERLLEAFPGSRYEASICSARGAMLAAQGETQEAQPHLEKAVALQRLRGGAGDVATALSHLAVYCHSFTDLTRMSALLEEARELFRSVGDRRGEANTLNNLGVGWERMGDFDRAVAYYRESLRLKQSYGDKLGSAHSLGNLATVHVRRLEFEPAETLLVEALGIIRSYGDRTNLVACLRLLATVRTGLGRTGDALAKAREAVDLCREAHDVQEIVSALDALCAARLADGDPSGARPLWEEIIRRAETSKGAVHPAVGYLRAADATAGDERRKWLANAEQALEETPQKDLRAALCRLRAEDCTDENEHRKWNDMALIATPTVRAPLDILHRAKLAAASAKEAEAADAGLDQIP